MNKPRYLPIGIQTFEKIRVDNAVYVDKTAFVESLVRNGKPYFLPFLSSTLLFVIIELNMLE